MGYVVLLLWRRGLRWRAGISWLPHDGFAGNLWRLGRDKRQYCHRSHLSHCRQYPCHVRRAQHDAGYVNWPVDAGNLDRWGWRLTAVYWFGGWGRTNGASAE